MSKKKILCNFNLTMKEKYSFLRANIGENIVYCDQCNSSFSIGHGGAFDVEKHIKTEKHKNSLKEIAGNKKVTEFFKNNKNDFNAAAREGVWAYHVIQENHSFRSSDCASKIFSKCFEVQKFNCARTKCEAIIKNVFCPYISERLKSELDSSNYVSISTDASNHGNIKMFPVVVRYFNLKEGVKIQIMNITNEPGETSDIIVKLLKKEMENYKISSKLIAFCGDNTNTNFGGKNRAGKNNVFAKLRESYPHIIGIGCAAHIVHNALQWASEQLPFDVELIVVKIYSHFYIYTVRVTTLMSFCESVDEEYSKLLGYSKTRFLALLGSVESILNIFEGLKKYFLETQNSPKILKDFFSEAQSKLWLIFLKDQAAIFNRIIYKIEGDKVPANQVKNSVDTLIEALNERKANGFFSISMKKEMKSLIDNEHSISRDVILQTTNNFYETAIEYLKNWTTQFLQVSNFDWILLNEIPKWDDVESSAEDLINKNILADINNEIFDEYSYLKKYVTEQKIEEWNKEMLSVDLRWVEIASFFKKTHIPFNSIIKVIEYALCLPGTSASVERIFSLVNKIWTSEKTRLSIGTLNDIIKVKYNFKLTCQEFFNFLNTEPKLLAEILKTEKYNFKKSK